MNYLSLNLQANGNTKRRGALLWTVKTLAYAVTEIPSPSLQRCRDFQTRKLALNATICLRVLCCIQSGREISAITVTDDYLCCKEPRSPYNFFIILIFNELFKFKTSDERQQ